MTRRKDFDEEDDDRPRSPRPRSPKPKPKHHRIKSLLCISELDEMLASGFPLTEVAKWVHEERAECSDITRDSLVTTLQRYRKDMPAKDRASVLLPKVVVDAKEEIAKGLDELGEMEALFRMQLKRVAIGMKFETQTNILNRFMNQEMSLAAMLLQKSHNIKMDLGFNGGRDLGTLGIRPELIDSVRGQYGDEIIAVIQDPEARGRALSIAKSLSMMDGALDLLDVE